MSFRASLGRGERVGTEGRRRMREAIRNGGRAVVGIARGMRSLKCLILSVASRLGEHMERCAKSLHKQCTLHIASRQTKKRKRLLAKPEK